MLKDILDERGISVYKLSQDTGISYSTINDIVIEKTDIKNASANMLYRLSKYLKIGMEALYEDSFEKNTKLYLYNDGRNVIILYNEHRIQYLGPKNLLSFHKVNKILENVIYVDCYFTSKEDKIYCEEDYIDLGDLFQENNLELVANYEVIIGKPNESKKSILINEAILISDGIAILDYADKNLLDKCVQAVSLGRPNAKAIIRLKDLSVISSNMSEGILKRAIAAVERNVEDIKEELADGKKYA